MGNINLTQYMLQDVLDRLVEEHDKRLSLVVF